MATYLFIVIPALGHLNPMLPVAYELKKRGHRVGFATGSDVRVSVESEGFDFLQAGAAGLSQMNETAKKALTVKGLLSNYYLLRMLLDENRVAINELKSAIENYKPDVLVVDSLTFAGGEMAELFQLPWVTVSSVPGMIPSRDAPPYTSWGLPPAKNIFMKLFYAWIRGGQKIFYRFFDGEFNKIRSSLGLPPIRYGIINTTLSPFLILIPSGEGFEYKRSDWPPQAHLIGPSLWGKNIVTGSSFDWIDMLPADKPVIYATLGTVQSYRSLNFFQIVIQALQNEPYQVVMSVGPVVDITALRKTAPTHFRIERFVPHAKILPRTTAVIHHGGYGIAQDCIYNGLPSVVIPIAGDLYENARRCTEAGISLRIHYAKMTPERLRDTVRVLLQDETIKSNTKNLQKVFLNTNAGLTGADLLERFAAEKKPLYRTVSAET